MRRLPCWVYSPHGGGLARDEQKSNPTPPTDQGGAHITIRAPHIHVAPLQVDVNMVVVNVTVTDPFDRIVTGLDQENFQIYDEKVEQKIVAFSTEDAPISVGMIFDSSGSMGDKIQKSKEAALQFFKTSNPQDEFMLISFSDQPNLVSGFTAKYENLQDRLLTVKSGGRTALLDAVYLGLSEMKKATTNRRALLVISDGGDNHSRYTEGRHQARRKGIRRSDLCRGHFRAPGRPGTHAGRRRRSGFARGACGSFGWPHVQRRKHQ